MNRLIVLDSGPTGLSSNPRESQRGMRCMAWLWGLLAAGDRVMIPEIVDYEVRREFRHNRGGYATLSFLPTLGTMPLGLIAGGWLRGQGPPRDKLGRMTLAAVV